MKIINMPLRAYRGTYYDIGRQQGREWKDTLIEKVHWKRREKSTRRYSIDFKDTKQLLNRYSSGIWDELEGISEELKWPLYDVVHEYSGYQGDRVRAGCSALMVNGIYARNYDYFPKTYEGRMMMHQPDHGFATFGFSQRMVGRTDGMNEYGLSIGYHFVHRIKPEEGFVCSNICRMVLENCRTTDEAVQFLKQVPHRHSFNYSMYDAGGRRAVVEASPRKLAVRQEDDFWCTNHFITEQLQKENRHFLKDSYRREEIFKSLDLSGKQPLDLFYLFNHDGQGIYTNDYRNWSGTIHTAVYEPASLSIYVGIGGNRPPVKIPFREFLNNERIYIKTIKGKMDTDLDFPFNW